MWTYREPDIGSVDAVNCRFHSNKALIILIFPNLASEIYVLFCTTRFLCAPELQKVLFA